jgi:hypothetical protein
MAVFDLANVLIMEKDTACIDTRTRDKNTQGEQDLKYSAI